MTTILTFCVLAAAGVVLWWLVRGAGESAPGAGGAKCPVCGSRRTQGRADAHRCSSCGAEFRTRAWHLREPTLPAVSVILLSFIALLAFALSDIVLHWQIMGAARGWLIAAAAAGGIVTSVFTFLKRLRQTGRN